ncbi:MAG TPA: 4-hydroxy-tetrahydrodipicolinate synthase [Firmicutes bacterium]|nr:4-hydroxy-tetrahydrodipicolinate synthase [Bacillota bacterium]HOQ24402.1 4-hydroxy-tetrahydrodipicolinate synthase [Bacillota bacterium]HPT67711.1 4-hydroxy-tetrahydrodipicolinate synthase [Bacillota bacterium]
MVMVNFGRILTAMITPFTPEGKVDYPVAAELAKRLVENGSDGLVITGTTGESPTLTTEEKLNLYATVVEAVGGKASVIAGTGNYSTAESIKLTREAEQTGIDGVLVVAPYYNKPPQEGLYRHFAAIAESTSLPLMVYNIPGRTGVNITPDTMARLARIENITAVKEASGNLAQVAELAEKVADRMAIYSGDDALTLPMLALGAKGVVSVASHLAGRRMKSMIEAFIRGDVAEATRIHQELMPLFKVLFLTTNPIMVKAAVNLMGFRVGSVRLPLVDATPEENAKLKEVLQKLGLI